MASLLRTLLLLSMLLLSCIVFVRGEQIAFTFDGVLNGTTLVTRNGRKIEAYLGIPYAKPPIGPLRFRSPVKSEQWRGTRDATTNGNQCPQMNDGVMAGNEDCLTMNIYTPEHKMIYWKLARGLQTEQTLFPTMVYIHGGDFVRGNGSSMMFGPDYLLDKDIVLVAINYRLGALGFLSTGDSEAPGNFGLKDQVLALQWIQKNIVFFRGDRRQVTLFGNGAGSYISQSGTTACFWAYKKRDEYKNKAKKLAEYHNCPTTSTGVMIDCLREVDCYSLVDSNDLFENTFYHVKTWGPTNEPPWSPNGAFLTEYPLHEIFKNKVKDYPSIVGHVADEGLMVTAQFYSNDTFEKMINNLDAFILNVTKVSFDRLHPEVYAERIKDFYFKGIQPSQKDTILKNMTNLISDVTFLTSGAYLEQAVIRSWNYSTYLYSFDYRGTFSQASLMTGSNENIGVTHGDEMMYLSPRSLKQFNERQLKLSESDEQMIDTMVELWTSFAYNGTPSTKWFSEPNFWQPYKKNLEYLIIGDNSNTSLSRQDHFREERLQFWLSQVADQISGGYQCASSGG